MQKQIARTDKTNSQRAAHQVGAVRLKPLHHPNVKLLGDPRCLAEEHRLGRTVDAGVDGLIDGVCQFGEAGSDSLQEFHEFVVLGQTLVIVGL